ncbi:MAG: host attachment protein [Rhizobiales bacterium]|nr:host attachment protein [Hyphomicrobiales bacterium]
MHDVRAYYVIADGGRARFVRPAERQHFRTIRNIESGHLHHHSHELGRKPPSRVQESASPTRHAVEPRQDPHDRAERDFAQYVARELNADLEVSACDALILAAPSHTLADIQRVLSRELQAKVVATLAKDLTKVPDADLPGHLPQPSPMWRKS